MLLDKLRAEKSSVACSRHDGTHPDRLDRAVGVDLVQLLDHGLLSLISPLQPLQQGRLATLKLLRHSLGLERSVQPSLNALRIHLLTVRDRLLAVHLELGCAHLLRLFDSSVSVLILLQIRFS